MNRCGLARAVLIILAAAGVDWVAGCHSDPKSTRPGRAPTPRVHWEPLDASVGRVATVNLPLRFVVLDYSMSRPPLAGDRLELSRGGAIVGELKTGYQSRDNSVVADVVAGTPAVGDEARPLRTKKSDETK